MRTPKRPLLYGPNNKPLSLGLYPSPRTGQANSYRPRQWGTAVDTSTAFNEFDWFEQVGYSRQLFSQLGNLGGAIIQKNLWALGDGWTPQFYGNNKKWGAEVQDWLVNAWMPVCNVRGEPFDFQTSLMLDGIAYDVDGDHMMILTEGNNGFPMLQFVAAHRVRGGGRKFENVEGGRFDGAKIRNGIIFDRNNRVIGYRVATDGGTSSFDPADYVDLSTRDAQLLYEPEWADQGRGIPRIARTLLDWFDAQDIDYFLKRAVKQDASMGVIRTTVDGEAVAGESHIREEEATDAVAKPNKLDIEEIRGGEIWYMEAGKGESIEPYKSERPSPNIEAFINRIERRSLFAVGWFYELLDPSKIGGASVRLIKDLACQAVAARQKTSMKRWKRSISYAVAKGMKNGYIPKNEDGADAYRWRADMPAEIIVDAGNEEQADRENLKIGSTTMAAICQKKGLNWHEIRNQTSLEAEDLVERAMALAKKYQPDMTFDKALTLLSNRTPNGTALGQSNGGGSNQSEKENTP